MKIKTAELKGTALDWAVAECEEWDFFDEDGVPIIQLDSSHMRTRWGLYSPSTDWEIGGPIIEMEGIQLKHMSYDSNPWWVALIDVPDTSVMKRGCIGPTPLIAAMRAFVASRLGDEVEIPDELT